MSVEADAAVAVVTAGVGAADVEAAGMTQVKAFHMQQEVQLRFLCPSDVGEVKKLCSEWFPIE